MRIFLNEVDETGTPARERLKDCPSCLRELERMRSLDAGLRAAVVQERSDLARARAEANAEDEQLVHRSLTRALAERGGPGHGQRARRTPRFFALALAACVLLLFGWAASRLLRAPRSAEAPEILLGGGEVECLTPRGELNGDYPAFSWSYALPPQWSFELTIRALEGGKGGKELLRESNLLEPRWTASPEVRRSLPDEIYWEVTAHDDTGNAPPVTGWARASRRR
jgi:hypothetical protein